MSRHLAPGFEATWVLSGMRADERPEFLRGDDGTIDRHACETALMFRLRDELKSGNVHVTQSKRFGRFEDYFIPAERWNARREVFFRRAGLPSTPADAAGYLEKGLRTAYDLFLRTAGENPYAAATSDGWQFSKDCTEELDSETQKSVDDLKLWLSKRMRRIRLADLLIEIDNELGFTTHFMQPTRQEKRDADDVIVTLAAIMAHGCNIGPYTMAQLTNGVSYRQLKKSERLESRARIAKSSPGTSRTNQCSRAPPTGGFL